VRLRRDAHKQLHTLHVAQSRSAVGALDNTALLTFHSYTIQGEGASGLLKINYLGRLYAHIYILCTMINLNDRFIFNTLLGKGTYGEVYEVYDTHKNAILALKLQPMNPETVIKPATLREITALKNLKHDYIIKLHEILFGTKDNVYYVCLLLDKCECTFLDILNKAEPLLPKIVEAVKYIHANNYCHNDLNPLNILINNNNPIIIDFGLATKQHRVTKLKPDFVDNCTDNNYDLCALKNMYAMLNITPPDIDAPIICSTHKETINATANKSLINLQLIITANDLDPEVLVLTVKNFKKLPQHKQTDMHLYVLFWLSNQIINTKSFNVVSLKDMYNVYCNSECKVDAIVEVVMDVCVLLDWNLDSSA
jgi:serine/threonine protein kinase